MLRESYGFYPDLICKKCLKNSVKIFYLTITIKGLTQLAIKSKSQAGIHKNKTETNTLFLIFVWADIRCRIVAENIRERMVDSTQKEIHSE